MIYFENASRGNEGLNTHLMSYTTCVSLSNFLDKEFFFDYEIPCSTPPAYAFKDEYKDKFRILLESKRSLVSDLIEIPAQRVYEIDRDSENKTDLQLLYSHFLTTQEMKDKYGGSIIWESFGIGRIDLIKEELQNYDLIEWTHTKLVNPNVFYFLPKKEKQNLLDSVKIRYLEKIESLAKRITGELGMFNAIHLRLGDFLTNYSDDQYTVNVERFKQFVRANFENKDLPILIATDGLDEQQMLQELFEGYKILFIDEHIFSDYKSVYKDLPFTDFNVLSILNQLICASAELFIGTYRSTFTGIIHRLRQERFSKRDFLYFPDGKVSKLLSDQFKIVPDRQGFFDWNRYSVFSEDHAAIGWMREWDYEKTNLNI